MAYFTPYIDGAGIHIPAYSDIEQNLITQAKSIFGQDIYLDNDSQDKQLLSIIALAIYDTFQTAQKVFNDYSPGNSIGTALDSRVKINGLARNSATYSTCAVSIQGIAGTAIAAGVVQDANKYLWSLPANIMIPSNGILNVTATCQTAGAIQADVGDIQTIATPQYGFNQVYNPSAATPGVNAETDPALRYRQSQSVALPSQTPIEGTAAAIQTVDGVARVLVYENKTDQIDSNGLPAHSIAAVVDGGDDTEVAQQIALHRTMGCGTYGSTSISLPTSSYVTSPIKFSRPTYVPIDVLIAVEPLSNYTTATQAQIVSNIQEYLNSLKIGQSIYASSLFSPALQAMSSLSNPEFNISNLQVRTGAGAYGASVAVPWNGCVQAGTITVTGGY